MSSVEGRQPAHASQGGTATHQSSVTSPPRVGPFSPADNTSTKKAPPQEQPGQLRPQTMQERRLTSPARDSSVGAQNQSLGVIPENRRMTANNSQSQNQSLN